MSVHRTEGEPHDELTELGARMLDLAGDRRAIVMLTDLDTDDEHDMAVCLRGYHDDAEAMADLLLHLRAILRSRGQDLAIVTAPGRG